MTAKRGQAGAAAGLIAIIAFLIVLYILLLPSDVRNQLINGTSTSGINSAQENIKTSLVFEHPGTLDPVKLRDRDKVLDSFNLYSDKTAVVLKSVEAVHAENGWLRRNPYNLSFKVDDLAHTDNYLLAFDVTNMLGRLIITLNGKEIFNSEVKAGNAQPIKLDKEDIKDQNSLVFSVSDVGLAFWRLNEYDLSNIRVIADFTDVSKRVYKNSFIISATEKENFEQTKLNFVPNCLTQKVGPLRIKINDRDLPYQAIPDCGLLSSIEFNPGWLQQGDNTITFSADEGSYFIDRVSIKSTLKELNYPFYYFELSKDQFKDVQDRVANVTVGLRFADFEDKVGDLNINGHLNEIRISNSTYELNSDVYVQEGQNYVQIIPKTILNIVDLKVSFDK